MTPDMFGLSRVEPRRVDRKEAAALVEVLRALRTHPAVAWVERMNTGAARIGDRFVRFGWTGCPDVLGQLRDGRLLGVEVKAPKGRMRTAQTYMLDQINHFGGKGFIARDLRDVFKALGGGVGRSPASVPAYTPLARPGGVSGPRGGIA